METEKDVTKEKTVHLFATLQALEKCLANSKKMLEEQKDQPLSMHTAVFQQGRLLREMRRTLNCLQLHIAKNEWPQAVRAMQIFYGLNSMVRPNIMASFSALANGERTALPEPRMAEAAYH